MTLKSKLGTGYPTADPNIFLSGDRKGIDPVLAGRLAMHAKANGKIYAVTSGYRSYEEQVKMYDDYIHGKLEATAAIPGTSWHGSRLAADISTYPIRGAASASLAKYGLCKPLKSEGWHIQPIETVNMGVKCNMSLAPEEVEDLTEAEVMALIKKVLTGASTEASSWAKESWAEAKSDGITDGTNPKGYVTREQVAVMIDRALEK